MMNTSTYPLIPYPHPPIPIPLYDVGHTRSDRRLQRVDIGSVQQTLVEGGSDRFRPSVGLGLRYITPIGPMGLLYGHKLDREEGESAGRFHLSIGYSF